VTYKGLLVLSLAMCFFFFVNPSEAKINDNDCKCDFDTSEYTAECDCAFACAVAVKDGKKCNIVCDGSVTNVEPGNYMVFGNPTAYLNEMSSIRRYILSVGFDAFRDRSFAERALPRILRSAYIGALFISPKGKRELDTIIDKVFSYFGIEVRESFTNKYGRVFKKEFQRGDWITASYKKIQLTIRDYNIRLVFVK